MPLIASTPTRPSMSLHRRNTRFGLSALRGATPESDDESNGTRSLLAVSDNDFSNKLRKRSLPSRDDEAPLEKGRQWPELHIPQAVQSKAGEVSSARMKHSSPWESLRKEFYLQLEDLVIIASQKDGRFVAVREFSGPGADRKVDMIQRIWDENFLAFLECFSFEGSRYVVFEHEITYKEHGTTYWEKFPVNLSQYALIAPYPTEQQLATILGQVRPLYSVRAHSNIKKILDGLKYLASI